MNFRRVFSLREDGDLSQREMGRICGVSRAAISQWESCKEVIPLPKLNAYANHFKVSMDYMLGLSNVKTYNFSTSELDKKVVGQRIKTFRKARKLTQGDLARLLNTSHSTISAYESGKTLILTAFVYQLAKHYQISVDWICGRIK